MKTSNAKGQKIASLLERCGVAVTACNVLGAFVHIHSFQKHEDTIRSVMGSAGFKCISARYGIQMDETVGYKISFKLAN